MSQQGPPVMGWGEITKKLGFKLGPVISNVEKFRSKAHNDIGKEASLFLFSLNPPLESQLCWTPCP